MDGNLAMHQEDFESYGQYEKQNKMALSASELRIGNLVTDEWFDSFKKFITVESINDKGINLDIINDGNWCELTQYFITPEYEFSQLRGIPLSEEILLKCGFEKSIELMSIKVDFEYIFLLKISKSGTVYIKQGHDELVIKSNVIYLHQLQNLYFALTGSGLETSNLS